MYNSSERKKMEINLSSVSTNFFYYNFTDSRESALIRIDSEDKTCMLVSIQPPTCPVLDLESNVEFRGFWSTATSKAALTVLVSSLTTIP